MKTIYFARHDEAEANRQGLLAGAKTDSLLTDSGRKHAHDIARALKDKRVELIVTSPLERASETAKIVAQDIGYEGEIITNPLFIERDFGSATDMPKTEGFAALDNGTATDPESIEDFGKRAEQALEWLGTLPEEEILVVSHAGFGQMIGTVSSGGRAEDFLQFDSLKNGDVYEFTVD